MDGQKMSDEPQKKTGRTMNGKRTLKGAFIGVVLLLAGHAGAQDLVISTVSLTGGTPDGVAGDSTDNLYFAVGAAAVIWKMSPTGVIQTIAGQSGVTGSTNGAAGAALFSYPTGIALDANGNIYVADPGNNTIRKITPAGIVSTLAGIPGVFGFHDGPGSTATFNLPGALAVDAGGNVYVADGQNLTIRKIDPSGVVSTLAGIPLDGGYSLQGIAVDGSGDIFVSCGEYIGASATFQAPPGANAIFKRSAAGIVTVFAGQLFVSGSTDGPGTQASFNNPAGLATDTAGDLFVADENNGTIREISPAGVVTTIAGMAGDPGMVDGSARFTSPLGIAVDGYGNVFITDSQEVRRGIPGSNTRSPTRFSNLSARGMVTSSSPLIGGFVVVGTASQTVLARGIGPTLAEFGVPNPLENPQLDIYDQSGALVASSAAGINATNGASAAALVGAFPLAVGSSDAPLVITLKPGAYTAVVSSPSGGTGTALVEVYEIP
jgi:sugar lactone lactonase YvrE